MGRSRSRSPGHRRERRRSRERDYDRDRERDRERERRHRAKRSHSRSPHSRRKRSRSRSPRRKSPRRDDVPSYIYEQKPASTRRIDESELVGKTEEEIQMMQVMGFAGFDSTKGKQVEGNDKNYATNILHKRKYRQYMNRRGGFNRPLDFIA